MVIGGFTRLLSILEVRLLYSKDFSGLFGALHGTELVINL